MSKKTLKNNCPKNVICPNCQTETEVFQIWEGARALAIISCVMGLWILFKKESIEGAHIGMAVNFTISALSIILGIYNFKKSRTSLKQKCSFCKTIIQLELKKGSIGDSEWVTMLAETHTEIEGCFQRSGQSNPEYSVHCPNCNKLDLSRKMSRPLFYGGLISGLVLFVISFIILPLFEKYGVTEVYSDIVAVFAAIGFIMMPGSFLIHIFYIGKSIKTVCSSCRTIVHLEFQEEFEGKAEWIIMDASEKAKERKVAVAFGRIFFGIIAFTLFPCIIGSVVAFLLFGGWIGYANTGSSIFHLIAGVIGFILAPFHEMLGINPVSGVTTSQFLWIAGIMSILFALVLFFGLFSSEGEISMTKLEEWKKLNRDEKITGSD